MGCVLLTLVLGRDDTINLGLGPVEITEVNIEQKAAEWQYSHWDIGAGQRSAVAVGTRRPEPIALQFAAYIHDEHFLTTIT